MYALGPTKAALLAKQMRLGGSGSATAGVGSRLVSTMPPLRPLTWHTPIAVAPVVHRVKLD